MIEKGQLIFFVYPCDSLSGVSFCSSFIGFYPLFSIFVVGVERSAHGDEEKAVLRQSAGDA